MFLAPLLAVALQSALPPPSAGALVSERVQGTRRLCTYDNPRAAPRPRPGERVHAVGRGEPCPRWEPAPQRARATPIPSLATLAGNQVRNGQRLCTYRYLGRDYTHVLQLTRSCPLTPHFLR